MSAKVAEKQADTKDGEWIPTVCNLCIYGQCATQVHVVDGVPVKVEGNPNAPHNLGRLCARGNSGIMDLFDPYRVKVPMKRTNPERGLDVDPMFVEISWEEAMDIVTEKLRAIREENPKQFMVNWGMNAMASAGGAQGVFGSVYGSPPIQWWSGSSACGNAEHCISVWAHNGIVSGFDPDYTELLVEQGTSAGFGTWLGGATCGGQRVADARVERGMRVVTIDPRCSEGANKGDWIPILPGTDLAFNLAVLHVMVHELNQYDVEFLKLHTNAPYLIRPDGHYMREAEGVSHDPAFPPPAHMYAQRDTLEGGKPLVWDVGDQKPKPFDDESVQDGALEGKFEVNGEPCRPAFQMLKDRMLPYTPEWAEGISTVPAARIRKFTEDWVKSAKIGASIKIDGIDYPYRPVAGIGYHGSQRHVNGGGTCMSLRLMNALIGGYDVPGGNRGWESRFSMMPPIYDYPSPPDGVIEMLPWVDVGGENEIDLHQMYPMAWDACVAMNWTLAEPELREKFKIPYTIKAMLSIGVNMFRNMGEPYQTEKAMKAIDFHIAHAVWIDEPALFADIVFPDLCKMELTSIHNYAGMFAVGLEGSMIVQPVVKPMYSGKSLMDVLVDLSDRLGFLKGEGGFLDAWNKGVIEYFSQAQHPARLDVNEKPSEEQIWDTTARARFGEEKGLDWFKENAYEFEKIPTKRNYHWAPHYGRRFPIYFEPLKGYGEMLRERAKERLDMDWDVSDYDPLPFWRPCPEHDASKFPADMDLYIINYKTPMNTNTATTNNAWMSEIFEADPYFLRVWMNEDTGKEKGLSDGDKVWLESTVTKVEGRVKLSQGIHPQVVGVAGASGAWATNPFAKKGINFASLIPLKWNEQVNWVGNHDWCTRVRVTKRS
jgi:anaerobic selenocysteine-containing dehydrogenase